MSKSPISGGAAVIDALVAHGVTDVFGIPGTHNLELYRYLPGSGIRHIVVRHEQGAGYAADGYARTSGRPGVIIATSGPGITNAATALATAYADSVPVLAIAPGPPRGFEGKDVGWLHEMKDQLGVLESVCGTAIRVQHADEIPEVVASIFERFATTRPRPAYIEIPLDVLEGDWTRRPQVARSLPAPSQPSAETVQQVTSALSHATHPVLVAGGGARPAAEAVRALADLGIQTVTTVNGKGILDESHPAALTASLRLRSTQTIINEADVLLVVGSELGDSDLWEGQIDPGSEQRTIIRVDIDPNQLHKNLTATITVLGDSRAVLDAIVEALRADDFQPRGIDPVPRATINTDAESDGGAWAALHRCLHQTLPQDIVVAGDASRVTYLGTVHLWPFTQANRLLYPTGYSTLGYGIPAAIGAKIADPDRPVMALIGDGAAMFSIQELMTATEQKLALPIVIVDNGGYGEIRHHMETRGIEPQAVNLQVPDLPALAEAVGAIGRHAENPEQVAQLVLTALDTDRPTVIHFNLDERDHR